MEKWQYKVTRVILSNQISFNETQNEANDKINNKQLIEFNNIGENGWELVQIMPRSKEDKFHVDLALWKRKSKENILNKNYNMNFISIKVII
ncbi:MAG: hypothetical protein CM15mP50_2810 [Rhodobacterales bacterium]|nr:MAG: hypothetical protein CM15mP50_2810 [Rhodobacterales bacterium]